MSRSKQKRTAKIGTAAACVLIIAVYFFPIYILLNVSVRDMTDLSSRLLPTVAPTLESYQEILTNPLFWKAFGNTILYTALEICFLIPIASIGGYGLARSSGRIVNIIRSTNILVMMIPSTALLVGTYSLMVKMNLTNSIFGIALLGAGTGMTGAMFFYTVFTTMIPTELDEAAAIDGAGVLGTYYQIILPQMKAVTITRVISVLTGCWNNYLMPMLPADKGRQIHPASFCQETVYRQHACAGCAAGICGMRADDLPHSGGVFPPSKAYYRGTDRQCRKGLRLRMI